MKVNPIIYTICFGCTDFDVEKDDEINYKYTIQYLREIKIPRGRGSFSVRTPGFTYVCGECGEENWG